VCRPTARGDEAEGEQQLIGRQPASDLTMVWATKHPLVRPPRPQPRGGGEQTHELFR